MKILYVAMRHDYGRPEQGCSFEHENFYGTLVHMRHDVVYFDFMTLLHELGREGMNQRLIETALALRPDLMFCCLYTDQFDFTTIRSITNAGIVTFNWFTDDHWRFADYSRHWAPAFTWAATTDSSAPRKYEAIGYRGALKTQWACNHFQYRRLDLPFQYEVSFVGMAHGVRPKLIERVRAAGINVVTRGAGWPEGRVAQDEMIAVFSQSRINLNMANASRKPSTLRRLFKRRRAQEQQIKGRNFEIPGCGGFLLTDRADNLEHYFVSGKEVVIYDDVDDLVDKICYYLAHEAERQAVAEAGYSRTLREHTYELRFKQLFGQMGLEDARS